MAKEKTGWSVSPSLVTNDSANQPVYFSFFISAICSFTALT